MIASPLVVVCKLLPKSKKWWNICSILGGTIDWVIGKFFWVLVWYRLNLSGWPLLFWRTLAGITLTTAEVSLLSSDLSVHILLCSSGSQLGAGRGLWVRHPVLHGAAGAGEGAGGRLPLLWHPDGLRSRWPDQTLVVTLWCSCDAGERTQCTHDLRAVGSCNMVQYSAPLPDIYQNFEGADY